MFFRSFRFSFGLVTALALAVLCNIYLVFLLWTGGQSDYHYYELTARPLVISQKEEITIKILNSGLNLSYLIAMFNSSTKHVHTTSSRSLISVMNKLKRELKSRGSKPADFLGHSAMVMFQLFMFVSRVNCKLTCLSKCLHAIAD